MIGWERKQMICWSGCFWWIKSSELQFVILFFDILNLSWQPNKDHTTQYVIVYSIIFVRQVLQGILYSAFAHCNAWNIVTHLFIDKNRQIRTFLCFELHKMSSVSLKCYQKSDSNNVIWINVNEQCNIKRYKWWNECNEQSNELNAAHFNSCVSRMFFCRMFGYF